MKTTQQKQYYNDGFYLFTMTVPKTSNTKTGFRSAIVSAVYLDTFSLSYNKVLERMVRMNLTKINLVFITDKATEPQLITEDFLYSSKFRLDYVNLNYFFSFDGLYEYLGERVHANYEVVFCIQNRTWEAICGFFATAMIDISGGSNTKKHLLSPHQHRLSLFLICLFGNEGSTKINNSFHKVDIEKKINSYSSKSLQNDIIDFAASSEILRERLFKTLKKSNEESITSSELKSNNEESLSRNENKSIPSMHNQQLGSNLNQIKNKREFHTSAILFNSESVKDILIEPEISAPTISKESNGIKKTNIASYLDSIKEIILEVEIDSSNEDKRREVQETFENRWIDLLEENLKDDSFFMNKFQNKLFSAISEAAKTLDTMNENKYLIKKFPQLGKELNRKEYIILAFSICTSLYSRLSYNSIAVKIGEEVLYYNYKKKYIKIIKKLNSKDKEEVRSKFILFKDYKNLLKIDKTYYLKLGDFFLSLLQAFPHDLFNRLVTLDSFYSKEPFQLEINKEYLEDIKKNLILNPSTLPMICKPIEWNNDNYGGYLSNNIKHNDIITSSGELSHKIENKDSIYKAVNYLNSIKFSVNNKLLDYLLSEEGSYILENIKPEDELQRELTLFIAKFYKNIYFYLNTNTDWRGRIYTQSFYLSYQSGDLSSSLLNFYEGEPITDIGKAYLYIYGANSHNENGISKASYADRINWVKVNYEKIINLDKNLILSADSPFIFTAFCLNIKEIHNNPKAIIKTPVFLDATCSGIQHLAALMKDLELGTNTNLKPSEMEDNPEDLYSVLLEHINKKINEYGRINPEFEILSFVKLTRKEIKTSVMTKVYNVTTYGISKQLQSIFKKVIEQDTTSTVSNDNQLKEDFKKEFHLKPIEEINENLFKSIKSNKTKYLFITQGYNGEKIELSYKDIYKIATIINDEIFVRFPALNYIYNYFIDITKITSKLGIPLTWITPAGLKITQEYQKQKANVVTVSIFGKSKKMVLRENDGKLDPIKQSQAIIPNIVHSLDAGHLINLINSANDNKFEPIITIHDCFGTLPNKMNELDFRVRKEFILIYSNGKFLKDFHNRFLQSITDNQFKLDDKNNPKFVIIDSKNQLALPSIPELGDLDIDNIKNAKYMIS